MNANTAAEIIEISDANEQINEEPNPALNDIEEDETVSVSREFLLGDLIKAVTRRFKTLVTPFPLMSEREQQVLLGYVAEDARHAVKEAIRIINSDNKIHFMAEVESVTFKDGVKATLKMINTPESHALADKAGGVVMIVIADGDTYMELGDSCKGEADQRPLFDASTEGTEE